MIDSVSRWRNRKDDEDSSSTLHSSILIVSPVCSASGSINFNGTRIEFCLLLPGLQFTSHCALVSIVSYWRLSDLLFHTGKIMQFFTGGFRSVSLSFSFDKYLSTFNSLNLLNSLFPSLLPDVVVKALNSVVFLFLVLQKRKTRAKSELLITE